MYYLAEGFAGWARLLFLECGLCLLRDVWLFRLFVADCCWFGACVLVCGLLVGLVCLVGGLGVGVIMVVWFVGLLFGNGY